jgi:DHA1 family bicyclomycin/chloramphenicol resistance-like MFS transporter
MPGPAQPSWYLFTILALISIIASIAVHMFVPALPALRTDLNLSVGEAQLSVTLVMFAMAFTTVIYGGLSDRLGRKPVVLGGLALFTAGAVMSWVATDLATLLAGRVLQGIGAGCGVVLSRAIARDVYGMERIAQVMAYLTAAYVMGPMLAPPLGGVLVDVFGWRAVFAFGLAWGVVLILIVAVIVPETVPPEQRRAQSMVSGYGQLLRMPRFTFLIIQPGLISGAFFAQATGSSFLAIEVIGISPTEFGIWFLVYPIGYIAGNFITGRIGNAGDVDAMVISGALAGVACAAMMVIGLSMWPDSLIALFLPGLFIGIAQGLCLPYAQAGTLAVAPGLAGSASGAMVFSQMFFAALCQQLVGTFADGTWVPLGIIYSAACGLSLLFALLAWRCKPIAPSPPSGGRGPG